ncbi:hypothetical protein H1P_210006 [Hyella patelloides LEGE 07179]|uniref:Uncharacterized protein n=1 Tax=Hyella patelloides LEGE 07179 TaxID=945734 RepID=A0A563VQH6_9CYAN|nr:hypothetical protein [Hyella patelloides]VEP13625.1 hypothetical protein H1P_210006 [Hyella patelloides LEGE 07179]
MYPNANKTPSVAKWQDLHRLRIPTINQLDNIKSHLDLVILALERSQILLLRQFYKQQLLLI